MNKKRFGSQLLAAPHIVWSVIFIVVPLFISFATSAAQLLFERWPLSLNILFLSGGGYGPFSSIKRS